MVGNSFMGAHTGSTSTAEVGNSFMGAHTGSTSTAVVGNSFMGAHTGSTSHWAEAVDNISFYGDTYWIIIIQLPVGLTS